MNKNTKMILGVGALAIVGYLVYKQMSKPKASFANLTSSKTILAAGTCPCHKVVSTATLSDGTKLDKCADGHYCPQGLTNIF
jgi:hypothetical protein